MTTAPAGRTREQGRAGLGLPTATALVMGNVIGIGIFLLPATLAGYGTISLLALVLVSAGALALAAVFGRLAARTPGSGGPYAYAHAAFGDFTGFWIAWSFWITTWAGMAGIAVAWVGYANHFLGWDSPLGSSLLALVCVWVPALVNLAGVRAMGVIQVVTTVLKFLPLLSVALIGLFFIDPANFGPFNATGGSWLTAVSLAGAVLLFVYSGVESASIAAGRVRDPRRNVGRATVIGTLACALVYLLSTVSVMGNVPHERLRESQAPFALAADAVFGGQDWGSAVAAMAVLSGIGAMNGWMMVVAEMPMAAARDGLFPRVFARTNAREVPWFGVVAGAVMASLVIVLNFYGAADAFESIVLLATFTSVIPYFFSACAQLYWLVGGDGGRPVAGGRLAVDLTMVVLAMLFSLWMVVGAGAQAALQGMLIMLLGVPVYVGERARARRAAARAEHAEATGAVKPS
ncbi:amino acid permease [Marinactinospora thermotolerans]|uniref:Amino acid/polyamine/organocation transporter, APC superfamily (TC 2.A.3) n=1 Tax=Marinactinospora thermotolerans DSM 45154 TaxID=1122192 RepID=A0A1T4S350_9ACTN|nr:amino acid permease [Marinactinospora thermotolerans]SKA22740.1 amino acid/polyamine/organocation transporter, APC superfamily (TC 2.A.3) [Marinactinospora thermotolerans DSM 45154]